MTEDPRRWSQPFAALTWFIRCTDGICTYHQLVEKTVCQVHLNDIDVPPTLVSFAVDVAKEKDIITPELKAAGNKIVKFEINQRSV